MVTIEIGILTQAFPQLLQQRRCLNKHQDSRAATSMAT
jgi:hypothetical protein